MNGGPATGASSSGTSSSGPPPGGGAPRRRTHWWRLPPRWVRRVVLAPAIVLVAFVWLPIAVWFLVFVAAVVSFALPGKLRLTRVVWLAGFYLLWDAACVLALGGLWVWHGFGTRVMGERSRRNHLALARTMLSLLFSQVKWTLRLEIDLEDADLDAIAPGRPLIVVCRHAGPGDSFIIVDALLNEFGRAPAIVLKDTLQWDPAIDILLHRIPAQFLTPRRHRAVGAPGGTEAIAALAGELGDDGALLIFPEGANATPKRRERRIQALRDQGHPDLAARAEAMPHVMPPHPGGVLAAMEARPDAAVVIVGHTGLERLSTVADVWRELPVDKRIVLKGWTATDAAVPDDRDAREEWLYSWWETVDAWIDSHQPTVSDAAVAREASGTRRRAG
ncbi:1-acyl-sn-glycerol-3-phosphate acyltransferase [Demequina phytophila]|uniref:1-acyl-sn-glycerol-3-phosphate acyltransferase n=1 Tax=Demequina phytophila TaxID=1638981 RepID=UPI000A4BCFFC|nr:1-acyl-sn-glycerol-3-phosphate acyltransferase [Demequina phytophila]